jgi:hypothetical protein
MTARIARRSGLAGPWRGGLGEGRGTIGVLTVCGRGGPGAGWPHDHRGAHEGGSAPPARRRFSLCTSLGVWAGLGLRRSRPL